MIQHLHSLLDRTLVPLLRGPLSVLHDFLDAVPPVYWRAGICLFLAAGCLWPLLLKRTTVYRGAPSAHVGYDLRWWAVGLLIPYLIIYLTL